MVKLVKYDLKDKAHIRDVINKEVLGEMQYTPTYDAVKDQYVLLGKILQEFHDKDLDYESEEGVYKLFNILKDMSTLIYVFRKEVLHRPLKEIKEWNKKDEADMLDRLFKYYFEKEGGSFLNCKRGIGYETSLQLEDINWDSLRSAQDDSDDKVVELFSSNNDDDILIVSVPSLIKTKKSSTLVQAAQEPETISYVLLEKMEHEIKGSHYTYKAIDWFDIELFDATSVKLASDLELSNEVLSYSEVKRNINDSILKVSSSDLIKAGDLTKMNEIVDSLNSSNAYRELSARDAKSFKQRVADAEEQARHYFKEISIFTGANGYVSKNGSPRSLESISEVLFSQIEKQKEERDNKLKEKDKNKNI